MCLKLRSIVARFPGNKRFAFTICDDTDGGTVDNLIDVYRLLVDLGFRTTKSVWPLATEPMGHIHGESLQDKAYLRFILWLQQEGFEISLHNVRNHHATRDIVIPALAEFYNVIGCYPRVHCNHSRNRENIYWGDRRFSLRHIRMGYNLVTGYRWHNYFYGDVQDSEYFWGDICKSHISYVRNLVFREINLDRVNPTMPYHDPSKPHVNYWFSSCDGRDVQRFCSLLCESRQDQLQAEGGVCIVYTHFGNGFYQNGLLHPQFVRVMRRLSNLNGWFVPVSTLLDYLLRMSGRHEDICAKELATMERRWFMSKLRADGLRQDSNP